jgi:hypothetical protein
MMEERKESAADLMRKKRSRWCAAVAREEKMT